MTHLRSLVIDRGNEHSAELKDFQLPLTDALSDGSVLLKLDIFGLSTNNITYAVKGNEMGYWNFFPVDDAHSQLPVWGYSTVTASQHEHFKVGDKYYGYFPMASHIVVQPDKITPFGFSDVNPTRKGMNPIYDYYTDVRNDVTYKPEDEAMQVLYRPLFFTSYLLHDYLQQADYFESKRIIVTSASSKTAYGLGALLHERIATGQNDFGVVAMTSPRNVEFVKSLGIYSSVMTYDDIASLDDSTKTLIVDHTGNQELLNNMADKLGDSHTHTALIGAVQNDNLDQKGLPKHGKFFFAPIQAQKCIERWGHAKFGEEYAKAWSMFKDKANNWVELKSLSSLKEAEQAYLHLFESTQSPRDGIVVKLS